MRRTRVLTWPIVTVFGFIAQPDRHFFLKPNVTKLAAAEYGFDFQYQPRPSFGTYASLLEFAGVMNTRRLPEPGFSSCLIGIQRGVSAAR